MEALAAASGARRRRGAGGKRCRGLAGWSRGWERLGAGKPAMGRPLLEVGDRGSYMSRRRSAPVDFCHVSIYVLRRKDAIEPCAEHVKVCEDNDE